VCALPQAGLFHVGRYRFHAVSSGIGIDSIVDPPPEGPARDPSQDVGRSWTVATILRTWTTAFFPEQHVRLLLGSSSCSWLDRPG
jgi:hypothetical protein